MNGVSRGAQRVGTVMTKLALAGYRCVRLSASGQRRGKRRVEAMIAGDAMAWPPPGESSLPYWLIEVGGAGKRLRVAFEELRPGLPPGWRPLVVTCVKRKYRWYTSPDDRYDTIAKVLEAMKE